MASSLSRADYTIGWICALVTEFIAAQEFLDVEHDRPDVDDNSPGDDNHYAHGSIGGHNVVIAVLPQGDYGISSTSSVVTNLARSYPSARIGLMVGIGGGAPTPDRDIRLGDVVVSEPGNAKTGTFQYDFGKHVQGGEYEYTKVLNKPPMILRTALSGLQARYQRKGHNLDESISAVLAKNRRLKKSHGRPETSTDILFRSDVLHSDHCQEWSCAQAAAAAEEKTIQREPRDEEEERIVIHYGLIASANSVMKDAKLRDKFARDEGVLCFEMEAGGLIDSLPCIVIRGICDYSDSHKSKQWQGYAAMTAAAFAKEVLLEVNPQRVQSEKQLTEVLKEVSERSEKTYTQVNHVAAYLGTQADDVCLRWLSDKTPGAHHSDIIRNRSRNTGNWFLESAEYNKWLSGKQETLFCPGIPGAGKTMMMAVVIDDLISRYHQDSSVGIGFTYYNFTRREDQGFEVLLASLLRQLSGRRPSVPDVVKRLHDKHDQPGTRPTVDELSVALNEVIGSFHQVYLVIDALDEYQTGGDAGYLPTALLQLQSTTQLNLIVTSRHVPEIMTAFADRPSLEISATSIDLERYISDNLKRFPLAIRTDEALHHEIRSQLVSSCDGMFLLMKLYMDSLSDKTSKRELKDALTNLTPSGNKDREQSRESRQSTVLDAAYSNVLDRILAQSPGHRALALRVLTWVTFAKKQLSVDTFRGAVCTIPGDDVFDMDNLRDAETLISRCCGLVIIDQESGIVRLTHYTTQEYLEEHKSAWAPMAHRDIATDCITHLMYDFPGLPQEELSDHWRLVEDDSSSSRQQILMRSLHRYSAEHWGDHVALSEGHNDRLDEFLQAADKVHRAGLGLWDALGPIHLSLGEAWFGDSSLSVDGAKSSLFTPLHLTAYFGLDALLHDTFGAVQNLPGSPDICTLLDRYLSLGRTVYLTPLDFALMGRRASTVERLVGLGARLNMGICRTQTVPLHRAVQLGHPDMIEVLVRCGAQVDQRGDLGETALMLATTMMSVDTVSTLLESGASMELTNNNGWSALSMAAEKDAVEVAERLLRAGVDVNMQDGAGQTPLLRAIGSMEDCHRMVPFLIDNGADVHHIDNRGRSALCIAARQVCIEDVRRLVEAGLDVNHKDRRGRTPLMKAVAWLRFSTMWTVNLPKCRMVTTLLLERGADVAATDLQGQTALMRTAMKGHPDNAELLIRAGADVNAKDSRGDTALMAAARGQWDSQAAIMTVLLTHGANVCDVNNEGESAFTIAVSHGSPGSAEVLMEAGVDVNGRDANGDTPLMRAATRPPEERSGMIRLLLAKGAQVQDANQHGVSALMIASTLGLMESIQLLIEAGADVNGKDWEGGTPLMKVLRSQHLEDRGQGQGQGQDEDDVPSSSSRLVKLLLAKGASVHQVDATGQSPLMMAARSGALESAELLLRAGADVDQADMDGETALMMAVPDSTSIVELLLARGASPLDVNRQGHSALFKALLHYDDTCARLMWAAATEGGRRRKEYGEMLLVNMCQGLAWDPSYVFDFLLDQDALPADAEQYRAICVLGENCPLHF